MLNYSNNIIQSSYSALQALEALNNTMGYPNLFVLDDSGIAVGSVTDGDIRRGLIRGLQVRDPIVGFMNRDFKYFCASHDSVGKLQEYREAGYRLMPVLDQSKHLLRVIALDKGESFLPVEAVIMAGGTGKRLHPLTMEVPKPLLKVGAKSIIEYTIDRLVRFGVTRIHISVNYLKEKILEHLGDGKDRGIEITYIHESEPLGTIGAVAQLKEIATDDLLVMNSDLLTNIDFESFYLNYRNREADIAVATIPYHVDVPYAIMELSEANDVISFMEKPRFTYYSNAGIYCLSKEIAGQIPKHTRCDAPDFILDMMKAGKKVISDVIHGYWLDIGRHEDYQKAQSDIHHIVF